MNARFVPVEIWPGAKRARHERRLSPFRGTWGNTLSTLDRELSHLNAKDVLVQGYFRREDIRLDGWPRSGASPSEPGVIVSFGTPNGDLSFPCDTYTQWPDNLRAIALALEKKFWRKAMAGRKLSYRAAVSQALEYSRNNDHVAAVTAWLNAAAASRYQSQNGEMCGREAVRAFNAAYIEPPEITAFRARGDWAGGTNEIATPGTSLEVFYWPMAREGEGKHGRTKGEAYMLCGTAMIGVEGVAGGIALSHVLVISEGV